MVSRKKTDLYLLGIGIRGFEQVSLETVKILRRCRKIIHLTNQHRQLKRINPNVVDWSRHYWIDEDFELIYQRLFDYLLEEVEKGPGVASVIYGHPLFFDSVHMDLVDISKKRGLKCVMLPGISSLDTLSVDLGVDYSEGLQVLEASELVVNSVTINPSLHTLVFQIGCFSLRTPCDHGDSQAASLKDMEKHLLRFYSARQPIILASSDYGHRKGPTLFRSRLGKLSSHRSRMSFETTLYIPPATN